jgi:hypothetical protein
MEKKVMTKSTPNKKVEKMESKSADGSKHVEKTTAKKKMDGSTEVKHKVKDK